MAEPKKRSSKLKAQEANPVTDEEQEEERRRRKLARRQAKKMAKHLAELGLDENGNRIDNLTLLNYPVRECKFSLPGFHEAIAVNPLVSLLGGIILWLFVVWSVAQPSVSLQTILALRANVSLRLMWFLQITKAVFLFFLLYILYKYGHIHLGHKHETPEFSTFSYFSMIFTAGAGPALLVYAVQEPLWHQMGNFFVQAGYRSQDEVDMNAINLTMSNWGLICWTHFTTVGVCMSLAVHRFNLPLAFRSSLYPILGAYTWGWIGDLVDAIGIVVTVAGSCTYMGLSAIQIVNGFIRLGWVDDTIAQQDITSIQNMTVWVIIVASTAAVVSGLRAGIRLMSNSSLVIGSLLLLLVLMLDDTKFLLNLQVQETGMYLQTQIFQLSMWTDAFGQVRKGSGRAIDGKAAEQTWMDSGLGRLSHAFREAERELIVYGLFAPIGYCIVWFCTWGGIGLRQARQASELNALGAELYNNSGHFLSDGSAVCYDVPQEDIVVGDEVVFTNYLPGVSPVCQFDTTRADMAAFNVLYSFRFPESFSSSGLGPWLSVLFILGIALFFVANSDAAVLVADSLASNGRKNYHWTRRMYWASTVGALTSALLSSGGTAALNAVQAASIVWGVPVSILLCYMLQSITLMCRQADDMGDRVGDYQFPDQPEFDVPIVGGVFNVMEYMVSLGKVHAARVELGMDNATKEQVTEFLKGLVVPFVSLHQVLSSTYPDNPKTNMAVVGLYTVCFVGWTGFFAAATSYPGLRGLGWTLFVVAGGILGMVRSSFRQRYDIRSNSVADLVASILVWPQVLVQMRLQQSKVTCATMTKEIAAKEASEKNSVDDDEDCA